MPDMNTNTSLSSGNDPRAWLTQHGINEVGRDRRGQHPKGNVVADPRAVRWARRCRTIARSSSSAQHARFRSQNGPKCA